MTDADTDRVTRVRALSDRRRAAAIEGIARTAFLLRGVPILESVGPAPFEFVALVADIVHRVRVVEAERATPGTLRFDPGHAPPDAAVDLIAAFAPAVDAMLLVPAGEVTPGGTAVTIAERGGDEGDGDDESADESKDDTARRLTTATVAFDRQLARLRK